MDFMMRIQLENDLASTVQPDFKASATNSNLGYEAPTRIEQKSRSWFGPMQCGDKDEKKDDDGVSPKIRAHKGHIDPTRLGKNSHKLSTGDSATHPNKLLVNRAYHPSEFIQLLASPDNGISQEFPHITTIANRCIYSRLIDYSDYS